MKQTYCIDTSFFISCWQEYYRKTFFSKEDFFQLFIKKLTEYNFYIHQAVYSEIEKKTDELSKWLKNHRDCFHKITQDQE